MKKKRPLQYLGMLLVAAVFAVAAWQLVDQFQKNGLTFAKVMDSLLQIPAANVAIAMGVTLVNYAVILVCYDYLAFRFAGVPISLARVAFAALTAYPVSYNFGATLTAIPLRYRLYSSWGLPLGKIVQLLVILALTFWFGVFFIAGLLFVFRPLRIPHDELKVLEATLVNEWHVHHEVYEWFVYLFRDSTKFGILLLALTALYVGASLLHRASLKIFRWTLPVPPFRLTIYQIAIASADMLVAASVLYVLFPPVRHGYLTVLEIYLVAFSLIVLSHVPGGWGILEAVIISLLSILKLLHNPAEDLPKVLAGIIAFRVIYYLIPLLFAAAMFAWHEYALRKKWIPPMTLLPDEALESARVEPSVNGNKGESREPDRPLPREQA